MITKVHIIARMDEILPEFTPISQLKPMTTGLHIEAIIIESVGSGNDGEIYQFLVGDETGCVHLWLWGNAGRAFKPMEIVRISNGYTKMYKHSISLHLKQGVGRIQRCGRFRKLFRLEPNISQIKWIRDPACPHDHKAYIVDESQPESAPPISSPISSPRTSSPIGESKVENINNITGADTDAAIVEKMQALVTIIETMPNVSSEFRQFHQHLVNIIQQHEKSPDNRQPLPPQVYTLVTQLTQTLLLQSSPPTNNTNSLKRRTPDSPE